jgi:hypothetical protein
MLQPHEPEVTRQKESHMTTKLIVAGAIALGCSTAALTAQSQQPAPGATTPSPSTAAGPQSATTLVGCLYREDQIPGRKPNVAERAGILEDYVLADASMPSTGAKPGATPGATGTSGSNAPATGTMYKVESIADDRLKTLVGKRVEVMGRIDPEGGKAAPGSPAPDRGLGPDQINLPEFEATSIREIPGTCPASPAPRSK